MNSVIFLNLCFLVLFEVVASQDGGCLAVAQGSAGSSSEEVVKTATSEAISKGIVSVQDGSACAVSAALAIANATANATAEAYVDTFASVQGEQDCGQASASGRSFAESTAIAIANATAVAFAEVVGKAEAQSIANAISTDVQTAIAEAEAESVSTGGIVQANARALSTAVASAVSEAYAEALAQFNSDECNDDTVTAFGASGGGDKITSLPINQIAKCQNTQRPCNFLSLTGGVSDCCQVDLAETEIGSACNQSPNQRSLTTFNYKGLCLQETNGDVGTYVLVLGREVSGTSISLSDCICEDKTLELPL
eukprot:TRINITY_DN22578_c0_g2_i3.p1 TRINITY_DN22578_c0_g2~~TRINITY_DN22578_c0_g2_i3.p1  ORF type:complete len:310 (+),score=51.85 TRINITY_DN22578_c0_g2_i3:207-1136(+)